MTETNNLKLSLPGSSDYVDVNVLNENFKKIDAKAVHASSHSTGGNDPISPESIGAASSSHSHAQSDIEGLEEALSNASASGHKHSASDITSGTLSTARLPTVPITKGGTGATDAANARKNLGAAASDHTHTPESIGAAPDGYGLGEIGKSVTDLNDAQESGFYSAIGAANFPPNVSSAQYGAVLVLSSNSDRVTQVYFQDVTNGTGAIAVRRLNGNGWSEWEFVNPPMALGTEYRTTKRYLGKPVYTKVFNVGAIAAGATVVVSMEEDPDNPVISKVVSAHGYSHSNNQYFTPTYVDFIYVSGGGTGEISLKNASSVSLSSNYVLIEYTKSTD